MTIGGGVPIIKYFVTSVDFWSLPLTIVNVVNAPFNVALPDVVVIGLPATITRAIAMVKFRAVENTNVAINSVAGAQSIGVNFLTSGYLPAINLINGLCTLNPATREGGDVWIGAINISALITANGAYNFRWTAALATVNNLVFNDIQTGLRIWF
jgi:hypothetical protein